jgi:predicted phage terminase large subunit-like protein
MQYVTDANYHWSLFSEKVCQALDQFVNDAKSGVRPVLILQAPPQHGKSELVSRRFPAYLMGALPNANVGTASYNVDLAHDMAQAVRRNLESTEHLRVFPGNAVRTKYQRNTLGDFSTPGGKGRYIGVGVRGGLTGKPLDFMIIDDPIKDAKEALSPNVKEDIWNWFQTVSNTRLSKNSGIVIMATSWAQDDLSGRVIDVLKGSKRLKVLRFPAINSIDEVGYEPDLPLGALIPDFKPLEMLLDIKATMSDYFWSALYQQSAKKLGGNVFNDKCVKYYTRLPEKLDKVIMSVDAAFKGSDTSDFVAVQVWGKRGPDVYLLDQVCERLTFTATLTSIIELRKKWTAVRAVLIEDKANGPAIIDVLKKAIPGIIPVEPDGSKLARAHAVTSYWEAGNVYLPHKALAPFVTNLVNELTSFPTAAHDDQVDALTQALRHLYPLAGAFSIQQSVIDRALGKIHAN